MAATWKQARNIETVCYEFVHFLNACIRTNYHIGQGQEHCDLFILATMTTVIHSE